MVSGLLASGAVACRPPAARLRAPAPQQGLVIVASIDAFPGFSLEDPLLAVPTLRRLAQAGAVAQRLTAVNPTTTWANHASLVTGVHPARHGVVHNGVLRSAGPGWALQVDQTVRHVALGSPTLSDRAHAAGLRTAHVGWLPPQQGPAVHHSFPDQPSPDGATEREAVQAGILTTAELERFAEAPVTWRDDVGTRVAAHLIARRRPDLMLFHLLASDWMQHQHGPRGLPAASALGLADARIGQLLQSAEQSGWRDRISVLVVSDHGFRRAVRSIRPNAALRSAGLLTTSGSEVSTAAVQAIAFGGTAMVHVTDPGRRSTLGPVARQTLSRLEGITGVIEPDAYAALGLPAFGSDVSSPDFLLTCGPGFAFSSRPDGEPVLPIAAPLEPGHHGYLASDPDMDGIFVAWGRGIRPGVRLGRVSNLDVAPTAARLLGLTMGEVQGRTLDEILV